VLDVLRPGVLDGLAVCVAGGGAPLSERATQLGARTTALTVDLSDEDAVTAQAATLGRVDVLVVDAATPFTTAGGGMAALRTAVANAWNATRAIANASWTAIEGPEAVGGKVVFVAPGPDAGAHATAVGAALANAARTLSVEWARFGVRPTAIVPRTQAADADIVELVAFLASPGGDYFSGCVFAPGSPVSRAL
jgi:citronellol/citronellal dehydrogenase